MSDPTIEEDSLISQDDIDSLLDSSSIEEAEDVLSDGDSDESDGAVIIAVYYRDALELCFLRKAGFSASLFFGFCLIQDYYG